MSLQIWYFNVGHGDCAYVNLPNGARMMIDCGGGTTTPPSTLLKASGISRSQDSAPIPGVHERHGIDNLVITHPHGDHIGDIAAMHDDIGFYLLTGGYRKFIHRIDLGSIDFKKRGQDVAKRFIEIVNKYKGEYKKESDRVEANKPDCIVSKQRFIDYEDEMNLNDLSWFVSIEYRGQKVLFTGDMTAAGIKKILESGAQQKFAGFVKGTTILKVPHHGREDACSQEMLDLFGSKPLLCIASDEVLNERNEGTSNISWYKQRTSDDKVLIDGEMQSRWVLTTRNDKDIYVEIDEYGTVKALTNVFKNLRESLARET